MDALPGHANAQTEPRTLLWEPLQRVMPLLTALLLTACGGGGSSSDPVTPPLAAEPEGMLRLVSNASELESSLKSGLRAEARAAVLGPALPGVTTATGSFSGTYTQELAVDELDSVRYDGTHLYVAPSRVLRCCHILPSTGGPATTPRPAPPNAIRILRTDPAQANARAVSTIPLSADTTVQGMYVADGRLVALTARAFNGPFGDLWLRPAIWAPSQFGLSIYDVSNASAPRQTFSARIDGVFVESRRVGDRVYIVSRYTPSVLLDPARRDQADTLPLSSLLPQVTIDGVSRSLVDPAQCYRSTDGADGGQAVITSITVVPLSDPRAFATRCYNESAYGVYVSERALYLFQARTGPRLAGTTVGNGPPLTRVHKFEIGGAIPVYRGSAEIAGRVWVGGQSDFRVSEFEGLLRLFTTELTNDREDNVVNRLFVLRQRTNAPELDIVSRLPNDRRPQDIGKPREQLYGVRFLGRRAYAVTFLRIDPLYVIDLADPADPRIAGTLELPGFSDFLHPVTDGLLLGLGESETGAVRVALFDVSEPGRPLERGGISFGGRGSNSEARYDRHAFAYLAANDLDRFTIPMNLYSEDGRFRFERSALHLFEIRGKQNARTATMQLAGRIEPRLAASGETPRPSFRNRAYIHDGAVYYVRDDDVWAAPWGPAAAVNGPL